MKKVLKGYKRITNTKHLMKAFNNVIDENLSIDDIVFACVGTDRSTGDSLGPLVGTYLEELGYTNVIGTIEHPLHAANLEERMKEIPKDKIVIAIDACLGSHEGVGTIGVHEGPLRPGAGVKKELRPIGNYHIIGIVNISGYMEYMVLQSTRLHLVMEMARLILFGITERFPLSIDTLV